MATFERQCEQCGKGFSTARSQARFCGPTCRSRSHRGKPSLAIVESTKSGKARRQVPRSSKTATARPQVETPAAPVYDTLEEQVRSSLGLVNALDTISGMAAIRVAQQIDRGGDSGSAVATLSKELSRLVGEAKVEAAPRNLDKADDIMAMVNEKILRLVQ